MKFVVEIKNNGDMCINNEFAGQGCFEPEAAGSALAVFLEETPESALQKPLESVLDNGALEAAYQEKKHQYLLEDAKRHLREEMAFLGFDNGYNIEDDPSVLECLVEEFEKARDCNIPENDVWETICTEYLKKRR